MDKNERDKLRNLGNVRCLGQTPHSVEAGRILCSTCGSLIAGAHLGPYQIQRFLGSGRSATGYLAQDLRLKQTTVVKLFSPDTKSMHLWKSASREALFATQLHHSSILSVLRCDPLTTEKWSGVDAQTVSTTGRVTSLLTACPYVPYSLTTFLALFSRHQTHSNALNQEEEIRRTQAITIIQQAAAALSQAHNSHLAHGALIPSNLLLDAHAHLWIADFGLARLHPPPPPYLPPEQEIPSRVSAYNRDMSPFWEAVTPMGDQYTFAIVCRQLLTHLLSPDTYAQALPALQRATNQIPEKRFPDITTFVSDLVTLLSRKRTGTPQKMPVLQHPNTQEAKTHDDNLQPPSQSKEVPLSPPNETTIHQANFATVEKWEKLGGKLFTARDYKAAVHAYHQALDLDETNAQIWLALGDAYLADEQHTKALKAYERTVSLDPYDPLAWSNRGTALDALGRRREAAECYERASQLRERSK